MKAIIASALLLFAVSALAASPTATPTPVPFSSAAAPQATPTVSPAPCTLTVTDTSNAAIHGSGNTNSPPDTLNIPIGDSFTAVVTGGAYLLNGGPASKTPPWTLDAAYLGKQAIISTSGCTPALSIRVVGQ